MATNLALNDDLVDEALKLSGAKSKKEAVNSALGEYVKMLKRQRLVSLRGHGQFDSTYNYKKARSR
jgi:Arc/MetJ family transcription regulator